MSASAAPAKEAYVSIEIAYPLFGSPGAVRAGTEQAEIFAAIAARHGFVVNEEGEDNQRSFKVTTDSSAAVAFLEEVMTAGVEPSSVWSGDLTEDDAAGQSLLAAYTSRGLTSQVQLEPTAAQAVAEAERLAALPQSGWQLHEQMERKAVRERLLVRAAVETPVQALGWVDVEAFSPAYGCHPKIILDDGRVLWGAETRWHFWLPAEYKPAPAPVVKAAARFSVELSVSVAGDTPAADIAAGLERALRQLVADNRRAYLEDVTIKITPASES